MLFLLRIIIWNLSYEILFQMSFKKNSLLNAECRRRVIIKSGLLQQLHDFKQFKNLADKETIKLNQQLILTLGKQIKRIENKILNHSNDNAELKNQYERIQTMPGVGKVLATLTIIKTKGF